MRRALLVPILALAAIAARPAAAEEVTSYDAHGSADATLDDARTRALDVAFAAAVTEAVADLAGSAAREHGDEVERDIIKRARRYVASFQVRRELTVRNQVELDLVVRVDLDRVRDRLLEIGVRLRTDPVIAPVAPVARGPRATLLVRVRGAGPVQASYGMSARGDVPGADRLGEALGEAGYALVPAPASGPSAREGGDLPVDDGGARALAGDVKAKVVAVVDISLGAPGPVRGTDLQAVDAVARLRLIDVASGDLVTEARVGSGAWGTGERLPLAAAEAAAAAVVAAAWPRALPAPAPVSDEPGAAGPITTRGVAVRIRGSRPWPVALAVRAHLAKAPSVDRVRYGGVGAGLVVLSVEGPTPARVASQIKTTGGFAGRVSVDAGAVEVTVEESP